MKKKKFKQRCNSYATKKQRDANKALCDCYPFLIPRHVWTDKIFWLHKPYDYTLAEDFPKGWWKAFGIQLCEELREECIKHDYLHQLRLTQIKEKFGALRVYTNGSSRESDIYRIIDDYSILSENICLICGRPDTYMLDWHGWFSPYCEDCFDRINKRNHGKEKYADCICDGDTNQMADSRRYTTYYPNGESQTVTVDLTGKAEKIRARWRASHANMSCV